MSSVKYTMAINATCTACDYYGTPSMNDGGCEACDGDGHFDVRSAIPEEMVNRIKADGIYEAVNHMANQKVKMGHPADIVGNAKKVMKAAIDSAKEFAAGLLT